MFIKISYFIANTFCLLITCLNFMPLLCCECLTFAIKANLRNVWGFCQVGLPIGIVLLLRVSQLLAEFQSRHYSQCFFLTANFI